MEEKIRSDLNILFVDDDKDITYLMSEFTNQIPGAKIETFNNGMELLKRFKENPDFFDIIILDMQMPDINGVDCLRHIKTIKKDTPVIIMTAFALKSDKKKYLKMGFDKYLPKPVSFEDFTLLISQFSQK